MTTEIYTWTKADILNKLGMKQTSAGDRKSQFCKKLDTNVLNAPYRQTKPIQNIWKVKEL